MNPNAAVNVAVREGRKLWVKQYCRQVATVLRRDVTKGKDASSAKDYKPMPVKLPCRVMRDSKGAEKEEGDKIVSVVAFEIRFAIGADVLTTDRVSVDGETFSVTSIDNGRADAIFLSATCVRVE